jgi:GT2 family glycosyltransferase
MAAAVVSEVRALAVVVAYDGGPQLELCVRALLDCGYGALDIVVVDNAGREKALERLAPHEQYVDVVRMQRNLGFAGAVNAGIAHLRRAYSPRVDDVLVLVNQDCIVLPGAIGSLVSRVTSDRRIGIVGARLLHPVDRTIQHAGGTIDENGLTRHLGRGSPDGPSFSIPRDVDYVTGALLGLRVGTWLLLGPLDDRYWPLYFEEVDYCVRARHAGLRVVYEPLCVALHADGGSSGGAESGVFLRRYHRSRMRFLARHRLRRGLLLRTLAAELRWLAAQRRVSHVVPALRAYATLPLDLAATRRRSSSRPIA